jgi:hypothetical protein
VEIKPTKLVKGQGLAKLFDPDYFRHEMRAEI